MNAPWQHAGDWADRMEQKGGCLQFLDPVTAPIDPVMIQS